MGCLSANGIDRYRDIEGFLLNSKLDPKSQDFCRIRMVKRGSRGSLVVLTIAARLEI